MLARYWPPTSATSTAIVHIRAGINGRPTTTRAWSCQSTRPYGDNVSSAAYSTNTNEQPDHNYKRAGHGQRGVLARDRVLHRRRSMSLDAQREFDRLIADGHHAERVPSGYRIQLTLDACRTTQLYR